MLLCFGCSWPISIWKLWRAKRSEGKSRMFACIVLVGYVSGILHKLIYNYDPVIILYVINLVLISVDLYLTILYKNNGHSATD
jgi:uncharacterized protein with PQ loop repeat